MNIDQTRKQIRQTLAPFIQCPNELENATSKIMEILVLQMGETFMQGAYSTIVIAARELSR